MILTAKQPVVELPRDRAARFGSRARREEEVDVGHLRRRATKLSGQILACPKGCGGARPRLRPGSCPMSHGSSTTGC